MSQQKREYVHKHGITDIEPEAEEASSGAGRGLQQAGRLELQQQFVELRAKGWSLRKIERRIKVSKSTLAGWLADLEEEIASLKGMELEALYETHFLTKEAKIAFLADQLKAIQKELKSRGLEDVSTDKLLDLQLKYLAALQEEWVEARPLSDAQIAELKALR